MNGDNKSYTYKHYMLNMQFIFYKLYLLSDSIEY